jgi:hypothetical protein
MANPKAYIAPGPIGDAAGIPKPQSPIAGDLPCNRDWWRFFQILDGPPQQEANVVLPAAPASADFRVPNDCQILIQGGTVSSITYTRKGTYTLGFTSGYFPLSEGDIITITYTVAPTVTYFPC